MTKVVSHSQAESTATHSGTGATESKIDEVVCRLRELSRGVALSFAVAAGGLIVDSFYGGSIETWRDKGAKDSSFRKLASRPDLPMSATTLYRCVAIYDLFIRMPALRGWKHVTASHVRAVLPLTLAMQESMLERAEANRWSVAKLEGEVATLKPEQSRRNRAATPRVLKTLRRLLATLETEQHRTTLGQSDEGNWVQALQSIRTICDRMQQELEVQVPAPAPHRLGAAASSKARLRRNLRQDEMS